MVVSIHDLFNYQLVEPRAISANMGRRKVDEEAFDHGIHENSDSTSPPSSKLAGEKGDDGYGARKGSVAIDAKIQNPLAGMTYEELMDDVEKFAKEKGLMYALDDFQKGALISQKKSRLETIDRLSEEDKEFIRREKTHRWRQPRMMYYMTS